MYRLFSRFSVVVIALALSVSVMAWSGSPDSRTTSLNQSTIPDNWKKIDLGDFSFYAPSNMKDQKVSGIDSAVWEFRNRKLTLSIDYGMYSNPLDSDDDKPEYHGEWISIDGQKAKVVTFLMDDESVRKGPNKNRKYVAAVYFPLGGENPGTKLTFGANCVDHDAQESAKKIFLSIKFKSNPPAKSRPGTGVVQ